MTIWYFEEPGYVVTRPCTTTSIPSSGLTLSRAQVVFQITASILALSSLRREIAVAGGVLAAEARDFPAQTHVAEALLQRALDGAGEVGDGELGYVGAKRRLGCGLVTPSRPFVGGRFDDTSGRGAERAAHLRSQRYPRIPLERLAMNVLLIGSGGREHALAWALRKSPRLTKLYCAPGNGGIAEIAECVPLAVADHTAVIRFCADNAIDLVVVGPEAPLVAGLVDDLTTAGIKCFGPRQAAARLEGSKGFTKDLCREFGIPTAAYGRFDNVGAAKAYLKGQELPIVVKADGLAAGKGVTICETMAEAEAAVEACFAGAFGIAGAEVVIEEFLRWRGSELLRPRRRQDRTARSPPRRTTSASATATPVPTPAAWAPTRRPR